MNLIKITLTKVNPINLFLSSFNLFWVITTAQSYLLTTKYLISDGNKVINIK